MTSTYQEQNFDPDCFKCANFLWSRAWILDAKLKWSFSVKVNNVSLSYNWKEIISKPFELAWVNEIQTQYLHAFKLVMRSHLPRDGSSSSIAVKSKLLSTDAGWFDDCVLLLKWAPLLFAWCIWCWLCMPPPPWTLLACSDDMALSRSTINYSLIINYAA